MGRLVRDRAQGDDEGEAGVVNAATATGHLLVVMGLVLIASCLVEFNEVRFVGGWLVYAVGRERWAS